MAMIDWARFDGLRVVGDVHGEAAAFAAVIAAARDRRLFVLQLGDLVDRGPDSAGALRLALDLVARGDGLFLRGNHDDKLMRGLKKPPERMGMDLGRTLDALDADPGGAVFRERVREGIEAAPLWLHLGAVLAVHGAFHPAMLDASELSQITPRRVADKCKWLALYGEGKVEAGDSLPLRTYGWIDTVPAGLTVLIGHDVVSTESIVERRGAAGGRVLFCDTGCGKGGKLSFVDLPRPDLDPEPPLRTT